MSEIKPVTFRLDIETTDKFKELASNLGVTQDKMLQDLIATFELENAKTNLGDRAKEIEEFQNHAQRIVNIYLNALELNQNSESRIREQFSEQLLRKQELISNIQDQVKKYKEDFKEQDILLGNTLNKNTKLDEELKQLKDTLETKESLIGEYKNKIDTLTSLVTEYKEYKNSIDVIKKELEEANKIKEASMYEAKELKLENGNSNKKIELLEDTITEYKENINQIKIDNKEYIKQIKDENKAIVEEKNREIIKVSSELTDKVNELSADHKEELNNEAEKYNKIINDLKKQFEKEMKDSEKRAIEKIEMEKDKLKLNYERVIFDKDKELEVLKNKGTKKSNVK